MRPTEFDETTLAKIRELVEANFGSRDELYAAADSLDGEDRERVCRRLAEHLAGHAAELQQLLAASRSDPAGPLDIDEIVAALFESIKAQRGTVGVLKAAERTQRDLKRGYDRAIEETSAQEAEGLLRSQRDAVEFGERVLRSMKRSEDEREGDSE
jgi:hypothetical protein